LKPAREQTKGPSDDVDTAEERRLAEDASRALRAGFDVHVAKPVEMMDLVRILKGLMKES
jgi:CheY-like chemotaxis protein